MDKVLNILIILIVATLWSLLWPGRAKYMSTAQVIKYDFFNTGNTYEAQVSDGSKTYKLMYGHRFSQPAVLLCIVFCARWPQRVARPGLIHCVCVFVCV